jgi:FlaA1/EpsC-like NDP-sugar epimerase
MLIAAPACSLQFALGKALYLYRGRYRYGSFEEVSGLAATAAGTAFVLFMLDWSWTALGGSRRHIVPLSVTLIGGLTALTLMAGTRYTWRLLQERLRRPGRDRTQRILVLGAGEGGAQIITAMLRHPQSPYLPVGLLDDDRSKRNLRILGVPVLGTRHDLARAAAATLADSLLVAIPSADAALLRELSARAAGVGLPMKVLPSVASLIDAKVGLGDIRDVDLLDVIGRRPVMTDVDRIGGYLTGKRVLVTGAGGSIGSELCRQINRYEPGRLIMLDRDESALHAVEFSIRGKALLADSDTVLADIRDREHLSSVFEKVRPHVVFHAAALKHLPLLQRYPGEAVRTNIWGTMAVLEAADAVGVERFVNISTDKAADPVSVLGYSKRIAERLTAHFAHSATGIYLSVRFGNVLGSRGSAVPLFQAQIAAGGPITVTDPNVTRYFMTIHEAVQLVIQAGAIGRPGEVLVLDMGERVRLVDVVQRLAASASRPVEIIYTGLRPGEKLHEDLFGVGEGDDRPIHPLISHVPVPPLCGSEVHTLDPRREPERVVEEMRLLCAQDVPSHALGRG